MSFFFEGGPEAQVTANRKRSTKGAVTPAYVTDFLSSRDGQDIIKAFSQIENRQLMATSLILLRARVKSRSLKLAAAARITSVGRRRTATGSHQSP